MTESGVDMSMQRSKHAEELAGMQVDWVITVCDRAKEACPMYPVGTRHAHAGLDDPPRLAAGAADEEAALALYRRVREEIRAYIETLPQWVTPPATGGDTQ
jgi:arsenate reductase (thioredoxin)